MLYEVITQQFRILTRCTPFVLAPTWRRGETTQPIAEIGIQAIGTMQLSRYLSPFFLVALVALASTTGCSVRKFAATRVANVLAESGTTYASDNDPDLVGDALPFGLKTMEGLLEEIPEHRALLIATASGFTQYAYAYVDLPAFEISNSDWRRNNFV